MNDPAPAKGARRYLLAEIFILCSSLPIAVYHWPLCVFIAHLVPVSLYRLLRLKQVL